MTIRDHVDGSVWTWTWMWTRPHRSVALARTDDRELRKDANSVTLSKKERERRYFAKTRESDVDMWTPMSTHRRSGVHTNDHTLRTHNVNPQCHACGSPWFDPDGHGGIACSDCDTPIGRTQP